MRLVVWNCQMGLAKKFDLLAGLKPDVAIVPECANPGRAGTKLAGRAFSQAEWIGQNENKGLGVFCFGSFKVDRDASLDPIWQYFLPVRISGPAEFQLLAVWAFNRRTKTEARRYKAPTREALLYYKPFLSESESIIAGDFNNSVVWDKPGKPSNFRDMADSLEKSNFVSAYHHVSGEPFGAEVNPTHFWRKGQGEYHIDYCFTSRSWAERIRRVTVGSKAEWMPVADHAPLVVDIEL